MSAEQAVESNRALVRERILDAFAEGARALGPRNVVMAELARDLGISTRTLYQHFASKSALVLALMDRWADQVQADQELHVDDGRSPYEQMLEAARSWLEGQCAFSTSFWAQLERDFPDAFGRFQTRLRALLDEGRKNLLPYIREDLDDGLALALMQSSLRAASDPERCDRLGISRQEAVRQAIEIWVRGTLRPVRAVHVASDPD
ncbi:MAG: TetR/AcrR family transcriptional regulator [Deltaproteobacteria bacterium]|nr:TetR/AcrR family transcriptional regulator [Deltaproteobacteria bacterium]MBW2447863.1 TetR/AcrR family transcriptional regulator [Deltaproteobacteria bacterium]